MTLISDQSSLRIAIIGAGVTGLTCARALVQSHQTLTLKIFEKSRGLGGRLATRRHGDGVTYDHGAQYVTARTKEFKSITDMAIAAGAASHWRPRPAMKVSTGESQDWIVGTPGMNHLVRNWADDLDVCLSQHVTAVRRNGRGWRIICDSGQSENFDVVVCTAPAPQAAALFAGEPGVGEALSQVSLAPCWALMLTFADVFDPGFDVHGDKLGDLAWIARNSSKPGRNPQFDSWVVHAGPSWSQAHLECDREDIAKKLVDMFADVIGSPLPEMLHTSAHRWRFALTIKPLGKPFYQSTDGSLLLGGDWCLGARVEYAYASGAAMARALMASEQYSSCPTQP